MESSLNAVQDIEPCIRYDCPSAQVLLPRRRRSMGSGRWGVACPPAAFFLEFSVVPACSSVREVAKRLGVGENTLREWLRRGTGPVATRINGRVVIRDDHLLEFLDQHADERAA